MARELKSAELSNGLKLPYVEQGDKSGVPVVFVHALAESWRSFGRVLPHLPPSIHAVALTQRGHGDADHPASGYGLEEFAADVALFMNAVGLEAAVMVGSSSGGYVVQRFAADHLGRTLGMVLVGAPRSLRNKPDISEIFAAVSALSDPIDPAFVREVLESTLFRPVPPPFFEAMVAEGLKAPARVWKATFQGLLEAVPPTETATISAPTLILWGDRDGFLPLSDQEALAAAIPGSRLVTYEGTGHVVHWEDPERVAADIAAFLGRIALTHPTAF